MAHAPKDLNPTLSQFVSFCWYLPDNDMCTRGNSHIYMNQYQKKDETKATSNINCHLLQYYSALLDCTEEETQRNIIFYVYAMLCSQAYLDEFEGALFTLNRSDDRARVPFVNNRESFLKLAGLGERLAEFEKIDYRPENLLNFDYDFLSNKIPAGFHLENSSKTTPFDAENEKLILKDGDTEITVDCPLELQQLNISGYDVIKNVWMKFNSYDFTHCDFTKDDMKKLLDLLNILQKHAQIVAEIDAEVRDVLDQKYGFFTPHKY